MTAVHSPTISPPSLAGRPTGNTVWPAAAVALVPAYQPTDTLPGLVTDLNHQGFAVVVVDDGSTAAEPIFTAIADQAVVLHHRVNLGKGAALRTGLEWIGERYPADAVVITVDADGQHRPWDVAAVCRATFAQTSSPAGRRRVVLGARQDGPGTPARSRAGHAVTRLALRLMTGLRLSDTQTGLRAFRASLIPTLVQIPGQRYEYEMNMLLALAEQGIPVSEVGIDTVYDDATVSHYRGLRDSLRIGRDLIAFSLSSIASFLIDYGLFALLTAVLGWLTAPAAVLWANILARIGSATANYTINKRHVFHSRGRTGTTALQYALLAAGILVANTAVLGWLTGVLALNPYLAKIVVELTFFVVSWLVQRHLIFAPRRDAGHE